MGFRGVKPYQISPQMGEDRETAAQKRLLAQQGQQSDYEQEIAHDQAQNARMDNSTDEGTSANGIGGDPTTHYKFQAPEASERRDYETARDELTGFFDKTGPKARKAIRDAAESTARRKELTSNLRQLEVNTKNVEPGGDYLMDPIAQQNRLNWRSARRDAFDNARKIHAAKYGLPDPFPLGESSLDLYDWDPGFGGVRKF